jgi:hypothetical protein
VTGDPAHVVDGPVITGAGTGLIGIVALELVLQPPFETVRLRVTLPDAPAVKETTFVPAPLLMVPLVMLQPYVAPACAATLALPTVPAHMAGGAVMAEEGAPLIGIETVELRLQPAGDVTVIATVTLPVAAGVKVMAFVPLPPVMMPFRIDQLYVAPAVAATLALPVAVEQMDGGAVTADGGSGLAVTLYDDVPLQPFALVTVTL